MATAPVTSTDELNELLRYIREGGTEALANLDSLLGLDATQAARAKLVPDGGKGIAKGLGKAVSYIPGIDARGAVGTKRMAMAAMGNPLLQQGLKYAPVVGAGLAVGDLVLGDESFGNKAMDAALMGGGALIGSAVPVVGTTLGATGGKLASDALQYLFGGGV